MRLAVPARPSSSAKRWVNAVFWPCGKFCILEQSSRRGFLLAQFSTANNPLGPDDHMIDSNFLNREVVKATVVFHGERAQLSRHNRSPI